SGRSPRAGAPTSEGSPDGRSRGGTVGDQVPVLALEHRLVPLVLQRHAQREEARRALALEPDDLVLRVHGIADERRRAEAGGVLHECDDGVFDDRRERRGADGRQRREQEAVSEAPAEARPLAVLVVVVDRMGVAGHAGEEEEVRIGQGLGRALEPVADLEVLEVALGHQIPQKTSQTAAALGAPKSSSRIRAAKGRPPAYQARCFLSWTSAVRSSREASISAQCRRMIRAFSSRETVRPAKIQGAPRAPRPIMTAAQPVARIMAHASSWLLRSPLPVTGIPTASTTEAMISQGARPENCCERVRGWTVIASTPSLSASRAISTAFTGRSSQPPRILIVRGTRIAFRRVRRISRAASGSRMRAAPWPLATIFATGQPMLRSIASAPPASSRRAASARISGSEPRSCIAIGCSSGR